MRRIIMASITAVVVIAVLAGTLIPVLDDATAINDTFTNDGYFYMDAIDATTSRTITWDYTAPNQITIDGDEVISLNTGTLLTSIICSGDNWIVRHSPGSYLQLYLPSGGVTASVSDSTNLTITIASGTITATNTAATPVTRSASFTSGYCITYDEDADYVMKLSTESAYMNSDSVIFAAGRSNVGATSVGIEIDGTIEGVTVSEISSYSATFGTPTIHYTAVSGYEDLYKLEKITFTGTVGDDTANLTYSYFVVPAEVTAEKSVHFTDGENAILNAIPVIVIVALLLAVVALVLRSRMD